MIVTLPLIALRQIGLRTATRVLVTNLSLEVCAGERWAVLGPNGAGKSTLLLALAGARRADAGEVCIDSRRIDAISAQELALRRALLADRWIDTFSSSVLDTVLTARYAAGEGSGDPEGALQWLAELDCAELAARDVRRLSRGERQRVALATTLTQDTPLLLLDEPTAHQDPRHQALVIDVLIGKLKSYERPRHHCHSARHQRGCALRHARAAAAWRWPASHRYCRGGADTRDAVGSVRHADHSGRIARRSLLSCASATRQTCLNHSSAARLGPVHTNNGRCVGPQCGWLREGRRRQWWFHWQAVPTKQTPHFGPTRRERRMAGALPPYLPTERSLIGISQRRSRRLHCIPPSIFRTPVVSVNRP